MRQQPQNATFSWASQSPLTLLSQQPQPPPSHADQHVESRPGVPILPLSKLALPPSVNGSTSLGDFAVYERPRAFNSARTNSTTITSPHTPRLPHSARSTTTSPSFMYMEKTPSGSPLVVPPPSGGPPITTAIAQTPTTKVSSLPSSARAATSTQNFLLQQRATTPQFKYGYKLPILSDFRSLAGYQLSPRQPSASPSVTSPMTSLLPSSTNSRASPRTNYMPPPQSPPPANTAMPGSGSSGNGAGTPRYALYNRQWCSLNRQLGQAVTNNDVKRVNDLLAAGADPNTRLSDERANVLMIAVENAVSSSNGSSESASGTTAVAKTSTAKTTSSSITTASSSSTATATAVEVVKLLLQWGADPNATVSPVSSGPGSGGGAAAAATHSKSPLLRAVCGSHPQVEVARMLLEVGAAVDQGDNKGVTPLMHASFAGDVEMVRMLVAEHGASVSTRDAEGATPLHYAVKRDSPEVCALLLRYGADPAARHDRGSTPLHFAAGFGSKACMELLLASGLVPVDAPGGGMQTPLHFAAHNRRIDCAEVLLARGADPNAVSAWGTPLQMALNNNDAAMEALLRDAGGDLQLASTTVPVASRPPAPLPKVALSADPTLADLEESLAAVPNEVATTAAATAGNGGGCGGSGDGNPQSPAVYVPLIVQMFPHLLNRTVYFNGVDSGAVLCKEGLRSADGTFYTTPTSFTRKLSGSRSSGWKQLSVVVEGKKVPLSYYKDIFLKRSAALELSAEAKRSQSPSASMSSSVPLLPPLASSHVPLTTHSHSPTPITLSSTSSPRAANDYQANGTPPPQPPSVSSPTSSSSSSASPAPLITSASSSSLSSSSTAIIPPLSPSSSSAITKASLVPTLSLTNHVSPPPSTLPLSPSLQSPTSLLTEHHQIVFNSPRQNIILSNNTTSSNNNVISNNNSNINVQETSQTYIIKSTFIPKKISQQGGNNGENQYLSQSTKPKILNITRPKAYQQQQQQQDNTQEDYSNSSPRHAQQMANFTSKSSLVPWGSPSSTSSASPSASPRDQISVQNQSQQQQQQQQQQQAQNQPAKVKILSITRPNQQAQHPGSPRGQAIVLRPVGKISRLEKSAVTDVKPFGDGSIRTLFTGKLLATQESVLIKMMSNTLQTLESINSYHFINHPCILPIHGYYIDSETHISLVCGYAATSLRRYIASLGTIPLISVISVGYDISRALGAVYDSEAHSPIHNFTLDNILCVPPNPNGTGHQNTFKICDFDLCEWLFEDYVECATSVMYHPPEILSKECSINNSKSTVYSFGLALCQLVYGSFPFDPTLPVDEFVRTTPRPNLSCLSPSSSFSFSSLPSSFVLGNVKSIISMCLRKSPEMRPSYAQVSSVFESLISSEISLRPEFWSSGDKVDFVCAVAESLGERLAAELEKRRIDLFSNEWIVAFDGPLQMVAAGIQCAPPTLVRGLVTFVGYLCNLARNGKIPQNVANYLLLNEDDDSKMSKKGGVSAEDVLSYVEFRIPNFVGILYSTVLACKDDPNVNPIIETLFTISSKIKKL